MNTIDYSSKPSVFGTGLIALDIVISSNKDENMYHWAGGTCGNVLSILSYLGWNSYPIARLNSDPSSEVVKKDLSNINVNLDFISLNPTDKIPVITQEITKDNNGKPKHKFHWRNCPKCGAYLPNYKAVTLKSLDPVKEQKKIPNVYFFDRTSAGAIELAEFYKSRGSIVVFEPSAKGTPAHFEKAIKLSDVIKYSDQRFESVISDNTSKFRPFIEIQTLGEKGLRYRLKKLGAWIEVPAYKTQNLVDTCGCGDWTTAGIISSLCLKGKEYFEQLSSQEILDGILYGQALGAWNCSFEGARSGMYRVTKAEFSKAIKLIQQEGIYRSSQKREKSIKVEYTSDGLCPSCPNYPTHA